MTIDVILYAVFSTFATPFPTGIWRRLWLSVASKLTTQY